jgi:hypothetical protein
MVEIITNPEGIAVGAIVQGHHGLYFFHSYTEPSLGGGTEPVWCGTYHELRRDIDHALAR